MTTMTEDRATVKPDQPADDVAALRKSLIEIVDRAILETTDARIRKTDVTSALDAIMSLREAQRIIDDAITAAARLARARVDGRVPATDDQLGDALRLGGDKPTHRNNAGRWRRARGIA